MHRGDAEAQRKPGESERQDAKAAKIGRKRKKQTSFFSSSLLSYLGALGVLEFIPSSPLRLRVSAVNLLSPQALRSSPCAVVVQSWHALNSRRQDRDSWAA